MGDRATWEFVNTFAPWFAAVGTITAALVALYLAHRSIRLSLRIEIINEQVDTLGVSLEDSDIKGYLTVKIVNDGPRDVTITHVGWLDGWIYKYACQLAQHEDSVVLPMRLRDGDEAHVRFEPQFIFEFLLSESPSMRDQERERRGTQKFRFLLEKVLQKRLPWSSLRAIVITSTGKQFSARFPKNLEKGFAVWHGLSEDHCK